jgi:hypothetical protein
MHLFVLFCVLSDKKNCCICTATETAPCSHYIPESIIYGGLSGGEDDVVRLSVCPCCALDLVEPLVELPELAELVLVEEVRSAIWVELIVLRAWMVVHTFVRPPDWKKNLNIFVRRSVTTQISSMEMSRHGTRYQLSVARSPSAADEGLGSVDGR